jgi:hypothetical protein
MLYALALFGYAVSLLIMAWFTAAWGLAAIFGLGRFNVGGVENTTQTRLLIVALGLVLFFAWMYLLSFITVNVSFT